MDKPSLPIEQNGVLANHSGFQEIEKILLFSARRDNRALLAARKSLETLISAVEKSDGKAHGFKQQLGSEEDIDLRLVGEGIEDSALRKWFIKSLSTVHGRQMLRYKLSEAEKNLVPENEIQNMERIVEMCIERDSRSPHAVLEMLEKMVDIVEKARGGQFQTSFAEPIGVPEDIKLRLVGQGLTDNDLRAWFVRMAFYPEGRDGLRKNFALFKKMLGSNGTKHQADNGRRRLPHWYD